MENKFLDNFKKQSNVQLKVLELRDGFYSINPSVQLQLAQLINTQKVLERKIKEIKEQIMVEMMNNGIVSIDNDGMKISVTYPFNTKTFDSKLFQKENPDLYEEYTYYKENAGRLNITIRN